MSTQEQQAPAFSTEVLEEAQGLLDQVVAATRPQNKKEAARTKDYFLEFLNQVVEPGEVVSKDVEDNIVHWIAQIDKVLTEQLNEVMHHPDFQKLESTWRGLHYLIHQSETGENLK